MALFPSLAFVHAFVILLLLPSSYCFPPTRAENRSATLPDSDTDLLEFSLNWKFLEAEFFLHGALGHGLDMFAPDLTFGGPQPIGATMANLDPFTRDIILQFAWHHVGHLSAINRIVKGLPRPLLDLSAESFAEVIDLAFERPLSPPFDPCASGLNFLIASYLIRYVGLTGFVGINPKLQASHSKKIVAGILAVEAGQDAVIRAFLYKRATEKVEPYGITVGEFTGRISELRNKLGRAGLKDEGILQLAGKGKIRGKILAGDKFSVGYGRSPQEILRILYGGGDEHVPGGFFPWGANGRIARFHMQHHSDA